MTVRKRSLKNIRFAARKEDFCGKKYIDTKTLIVSLMAADKKDCLSVDRLEKATDFIFEELAKRGKTKDYEIATGINKYSIARTVQYNNDLFELDTDGEKIRMKDGSMVFNFMEIYSSDITIATIVELFAVRYPCN